MKSEKPSATKKGALERHMQRKEQGYSLSTEMVQSGFFSVLLNNDNKVWVAFDITDYINSISKDLLGLFIIMVEGLVFLFELVG